MGWRKVFVAKCTHYCSPHMLRVGCHCVGWRSSLERRIWHCPISHHSTTQHLDGSVLMLLYGWLFFHSPLFHFHLFPVNQSGHASQIRHRFSAYLTRSYTRHDHCRPYTQVCSL